MAAKSRNFRQAYCETFGGEPEVFEERVFWRCLYRRAFLLSALLYWWNKDHFRPDFRLIRQLGVCSSNREFRSEVETYEYEDRMRGGFLRCNCRMRISGRRLISLERAVRASYKNAGQ